MPEIVHEREIALAGGDGHRYLFVRAVAQPMSKVGWEARLEFINENGERVVTDRETTQSKLEDLIYWAEGLEPVFFEGALRRALETRVPSR